MAFVVFDSEEAYRTWQTKISARWPVTMLAGQGKQPVLALPDAVLDELADRGITFTVIEEKQLARYLSPGGLAYYRHLRQIQPECLYFNAPLPPALHMAMSCNVAEVHVEAVRQIVERYQPVAFRTSDVAVLAISSEPDAPAGPEMLVKVEFTVPRVHQQALMEALMASGAAGYSRETAIFVQSDPDGPAMRD